MHDGTITAALQTRKPLKKRLRPGEKIDADGIYRTYLHKCDNFIDLPDRDVIIRQVAMAGRFNTRRAVRELVLPRLEVIEHQLALISEQLTALLGSRMQDTDQTS